MRLLQSYLYVFFLFAANQPVWSQIFETPQSIGGVINTYASVTSIPGANQMNVATVTGFSSCQKVLVLQMKGAAIDLSDSPAFGDITDIGNTGNYEVVEIQSISGSTITFSADLINNYDVAGLVQLVSIPVYNAGASLISDLTCVPWNGSTGGILAFEATSLLMDYRIDVSGMGFRGGEENGDNFDHCRITDVFPAYDYASPVTDIKGAEKGEGIVQELDLLHGRGKLASGGGGGNVHNGGGGGGSNYGTGGLGGYSASICSPDAVAQVQGQGIGGVTLSSYYTVDKVFLGGGGGAGQGNNNSSSSSFPDAQNDNNFGGAGGGIIFAKIDELIIDWSISFGDWYITADGGNAPQKDDPSVLFDGAGGGGGAGTVLLDIRTITNNTGDPSRAPIVTANGGIGGYSANGTSDCYAPGGGGGGGMVWWGSAARPVGLQGVFAIGGEAGEKAAAQTCPGNYGATAGTDGLEQFDWVAPAPIVSGTSPTVSISEDQNDVCEGTPIELTAVTMNTGSTTTFQWQVNGADVGTDSPTYSSSGFSEGDLVRVIIETTLGCSGTEIDTSNVIEINITPGIVPEVNIATSDNNTCPGTSITFNATPTNGGTTPIYQWQVNGVNVGTNSPIFSSSTLANGDIVRVELMSNAACADPAVVFSNSITMVIESTAIPEITIISDETEVCEGGSVTFSATISNGGPNPTIDWWLNGVMVGTNSLTYSNTLPANNDSVVAVLTSDLTCAVELYDTSNYIIIVVNPQTTPEVSITESENDICEGTSVTFVATATDGGVPQFQWQVNGVDVGTNQDSFMSTTLEDGDVVTVIMTSTLSCLSANPVTSNSITMRVLANVFPIATVAADQNGVCPNTLITFSATPTNGGTTPTYQWQVNGGNVGTNSPTFSSSTLANGDVIRVELTSNAACVDPAVVFSNSITMVIESEVIPEITIISDETEVCEGSTVTYSATISSGGLNPTIDWWLNGVMVGTNSLTYSNTLPANNDSVVAVLTSDLTCAVEPYDTSNHIIIVVNPQITPEVSITENENDICEGTSVTFIATATDGGVPQFQWQVNGADVGTNQDSFTSTTLAQEDEVRVEMTSTVACANPRVVLSNEIEMGVISAVTSSVIISADQVDVCPGALVTFDSEVQNGGSSPTFQWYVNGTPVGLNNQSFSSSTLQDEDRIEMVMTSSLNCITENPVTSNLITMNVGTVVPDFEISGETAVCFEESSIYAVSQTTGGGLTPSYRWSINGVALSTSPNFSYLADQETVNMQVEFTSSADCAVPSTVTKSIAVTTIRSNPKVIINTEDLMVCEHATPIIEVASTSDGGINPQFQWLVNGIPFNEIGERVSIQVAMNDEISVLMSADSECNVEDVVSNTLIFETMDCELGIPNTFTPNNDGENDFWNLRGVEEFERLQIQVFNRWGNIVLESFGTYKPWDGRRNNRQLPVGTYYYVIVGAGLNEQLSGNITIIR